MKEFNLTRYLAKAILYAGIIICPSLNESTAQTTKLFPLKAGKTYHVEFPGTSGEFTVVTPPGTNGWAVVNIESGFRGSNLHSSIAIGLNLNLAILIEELGDAASVKAARSIKANRDAIINDLNNITANAYQYRIRPSSMGGGQGSYTGYAIPSKLATTENGTYIATASENSVAIVAASLVNPKNTISVSADQDGRLTGWTYGGDFK